MQKNNLAGNIIAKYLDKLQKCHPIFSGPMYSTESPFVDQMWNFMSNRNIEFINEKNLNIIQEKKLTCQYVQFEDHNECSDTICKHNLVNVDSMYRYRRGKIRLKKFEQVVGNRELMSTFQTPRFWQQINDNETTIINKIEQNKTFSIIRDMEDFEKSIINEFKERTALLQLNENIWSDGSYNDETKQGGAAIVIETENGEMVVISRHISFVQDSTETELYGIWMCLIVMELNTQIKTINTDSQAAIAIVESSSKTKIERLREGNWSLRNHIRMLRQKVNCELKWIKGHSGTKQNEMADNAAKSAMTQVESYCCYVERNGSLPWIMLVNGTVVEEYPRSIIKKINLSARTKDLQANSQSFSSLTHDKSEEQVTYLLLIYFI